MCAVVVSGYGETERWIGCRSYRFGNGDKLLSYTIAVGGVIIVIVCEAFVDLDGGAGFARSATFHAPELFRAVVLPVVARLPVETETECPRGFAGGYCIYIVIFVLLVRGCIMIAGRIVLIVVVWCGRSLKVSVHGLYGDCRNLMGLGLVWQCDRDIWQLCIRIFMIGVLPKTHFTSTNIPTTTITSTTTNPAMPNHTLDQIIPTKTLPPILSSKISISSDRTFTFAIQYSVIESFAS
mmetsp:Transcript_15567/g.26568  ORF Transcript_15567/g.26568 Transcript_15567/m.26568 type:complete len:238 (-) Transcript_15567:222-935(-)